MKILVVTGEWFPDFLGGTARVVRATAEKLAQRGHEVVVIVPRADGQPWRDSAGGAQVRRSIHRSGALPHSLTDLYEIRRAVREAEPEGWDLVLAHGQTAATAAMAATRRIPVFYVFHASAFREERHRRSHGIRALDRFRSMALTPILLACERIALRRAHRILVLSEFSRELVCSIEAEAADHVELVGGGVDVECFSSPADRESLRRRLGIAPGETVLLTARRLVPRMGLENLIEAVALLRSSHRHLRLVVIGDGESRASLVEQRDARRLQETIEFLGSVPDQVLVDWYRAADAFLLPTVAFEGFGMVTAEALACGTPVVATPVGATPELLEPFDPALIATGTHPEALVAATVELIERTDDSYRSRCAAYAKDRFDWDAVMPRWEAALSDAAKA